MPSYAFLRAPIHCPTCDTEVADELWFQWGFCRGRAPWPESTYSLGDAIRWASCPDGSTLAWTYFTESDQGGGNIGAPELRDLIARDTGQEWLHGPCPNCKADLDGGAIEIRDGRIVRAWLAVAGEFGSDDEYWDTTDAGLRPLPFGDHPMAVSDCRATVTSSSNR